MKAFTIVYWYTGMIVLKFNMLIIPYRSIKKMARVDLNLKLPLPSTDMIELKSQALCSGVEKTIL